MTRPLSDSVFVQYLMAIAVITGIERIEGLEKIPLRIKWPNDIYVESKNCLCAIDGDPSAPASSPLHPKPSTAPQWTKIGGILVHSTMSDNKCTLTVGCGLNVSNPEPTTSIHQILANSSSFHPSVPTPRIEIILAHILARFDELFAKFVHTGFDPFLDDYYRLWIHTHQNLRLLNARQAQGAETVTDDVTILGINRFGHLHCRSESKADVFYDLQPGGNSFNLMEGMIVEKVNA